jgi:hypothetical protein
VPPDLYPGVVSRLKILAGLDIAERRLPQDGRIRHRSHGRELDLRVATAPSIHGEAMALRIPNYQSGLKDLDDLQMPAGAASAAATVGGAMGRSRRSSALDRRTQAVATGSRPPMAATSSGRLQDSAW